MTNVVLINTDSMNLLNGDWHTTIMLHKNITTINFETFVKKLKFRTRTDYKINECHYRSYCVRKQPSICDIQMFVLPIFYVLWVRNCNFKFNMVRVDMQLSDILKPTVKSNLSGKVSLSNNITVCSNIR